MSYISIPLHLDSKLYRHRIKEKKPLAWPLVGAGLAPVACGPLLGHLFMSDRWKNNSVFIRFLNCYIPL